MSYDVYFPGTSQNYTSNVIGMWHDALDMSLADLIQSFPLASDLGPKIRAGINRMEDDPQHYAAMNPANGWGNSEGALAYLRWIAEQCDEWPTAVVFVSR